ncbi:MAG: TonB-dependent receptor, partial [Bacteroidetes bacterium]
ELAFARHWRARATYTFSDFRFREYHRENELLDGEFLPGIPRHFGAFSVEYHEPRDFFLTLQSRFAGHLFADDFNETRVDGYALVNLHFGWEKKVKNWRFLYFYGADNLLNVRYFDNIRINAFGGRYYEPGPRLTLFAGVRVRWE